jgi:hypothetical protein
MELFLKLEVAYIVIGLFFLAVTVFVTTRDFMPKVAFKRGVIGMIVLFSVMIFIHYEMTTSRMDGVKKIFNDGGVIICENKMRRTISQSVLISKQTGWSLAGDEFTSPAYSRNFFTARCVDYDSVKSDLKEEK